MTAIDPTDPDRIRLVENRKKREAFLKAERRFVERHIASLRAPGEPDITVEEAKRAFRKQRKRIGARVTRRCPTCEKRRNIERFWTRELSQCDDCADRANRRASRKRAAARDRSVQKLENAIRQHAERAGLKCGFLGTSAIQHAAREVGVYRDSESAPFTVRQWRKLTSRRALDELVGVLVRR